MKVKILDYETTLKEVRGSIVGHLIDSKHKKMKIHTPTKVFTGVQGALGSVSVIEEEKNCDQG